MTARDPAGEAAAARLCKAVDFGAVRANVNVLRAAAGGRRIMAVVKGDAYGLGAPAVSTELLDAGVEALAVDTVAEGIALREHGARCPVLVMDVDVADNAELYAEHRLLPAVATEEQVLRHGTAARRRGTPVTVWLRTNIGFNRFGPRDDAGFAAVLESLRRQGSAVRTAAVFAHLSSSAVDPVETAEQARTFRTRVAAARAVLGPGVESSLAATHGLLHPAALDGTAWVRPGIGLYGIVVPDSRRLPGWEASGLAALRPAVSVRARVLEVVTLTRAEGLGYDRSALPAGRRVASVAVGFSRGLHSVRGEFTGIVRGRSCPMVGRPGMDCAQFDVTDVPGVRPGDWMTLLGDTPPGEGGGGKSAGTVCAELARSPYELLSTWRMPVKYVHPGTQRSTSDMSDALTERIPHREPVLRRPPEAADGSVEALLGDCLRAPADAEGAAGTGRHEDLLTALGGALDRGLRQDDEAALLDVHRSAYAVYETLLGHPLGPGARHERSPWFNTFRAVYEERVLAADVAGVAGRLPDPSDAARPSFVRDWFLSEAKQRNALDRTVETYLEHRASVEQLAAFIQADGYLNYRFWDALALTQPHFMESVKHEISKHMWDEAGEGEAKLAHTVQFARSLRRIGLDLPAVPPWEDWRPYAGHNLYFLLGCNRRHLFKALGSLAMPELFDVDRDTAVIRGLERHGFVAEEDFEFFHNHVEGDAEHGPEWLDGVVLPIVDAEPEAGMELITGGALRMAAMRRYNEYLAEKIGLAD